MEIEMLNLQNKFKDETAKRVRRDSLIKRNNSIISKRPDNHAIKIMQENYES